MFEVNGGGDILSTKAEFVCTGVLVGIRAVWLHICAILACSNPFNRAVVSVVLQHRSVVGDTIFLPNVQVAPKSAGGDKISKSTSVKQMVHLFKKHSVCLIAV